MTFTTGKGKLFDLFEGRHKSLISQEVTLRKQKVTKSRDFPTAEEIKYVYRNKSSLTSLTITLTLLRDRRKGSLLQKQRLLIESSTYNSGVETFELFNDLERLKNYTPTRWPVMSQTDSL